MKTVYSVTLNGSKVEKVSSRPLKTVIVATATTKTAQFFSSRGFEIIPAVGEQALVSWHKDHFVAREALTSQRSRCFIIQGYELEIRGI